MGHFPAASSGLVSASVNDVALVNGTPQLLSLTVPNDGNPHVILAGASIKIVTGALTGGALTWRWKTWGANGLQVTATVVTSVTTVGPRYGSLPFGAANMILVPGTTLTLTQSTAMTGGAGVVYAKAVIF